MSDNKTMTGEEALSFIQEEIKINGAGKTKMIISDSLYMMLSKLDDFIPEKTGGKENLLLKNQIEGYDVELELTRNRKEITFE